ncbi:DUF3231 family protein [Paenibacillus ferrarius]|uniref:DUF3231 family protein n=1 Tax=Paenibacillus ferrarius TaxID=1469647 RepID=UPI003D2D75FF
MGILSGNQKDEPLHYGEIYALWQLSMAAKGCISVNRAYQYHAGDKDLKKLINDVIDQAELEASESDAILTSNGIVPPPSLPDRPETKLEDIPVGVKFSDQELASMIWADNSVSLVACSQNMVASTREDVGALFAKYNATKAALGLRLLKMNKEKGWLIPPPLQIKRPELVEA